MTLVPPTGKSSAPILFAQPWQETPDADFQAARAWLNWSGSDLIIRAELDDRDIFSEATAHNQPLFLLGDTFEIFLMRSGADEYFELHVSPENYHAVLRWQRGGIDQVRDGQKTLADFHGSPDAFSSDVTRSAAGWTVEAQIPSALIGLDRLTAGQHCLLSLSRYDYAGPGAKPVLSTISAHPIKNFHRTEDWLSIQLAD